MRFLPLLTLGPALARILVPPPPGPYDVAVGIQPVTDMTRARDPFGTARAGGSSRGRQLLLSVFLPVGVPHGEAPCRRVTMPYMTAGVAAEYGAQAAGAGLPRDLYARFAMEVCDAARKLPGTHNGSYPVVLFTPGLRESRLLYGAGARSLASRGYVVVTVDHALEASVVEFPDGTVVRGRRGLAAGDHEMLVRVRAADLSFVLDQLHGRGSAEALLGPLPARSLDLGRIVVYGHSLGGAAAAAVARSDGRVRAGIDLDGLVVDPVRRLGLDTPFLLAGRYNHSGEDGTWNDVWPHLRGPRMELAIRGTAHASFTDRPLLVSALRLPGSALKGLEGVLGSVEGRRLESIVNDVLVGFMDRVLYGKDEGMGLLVKKYAGQVLIPRSNL
ncbi:hypothetical protein E4U53_005131 [Claviceps sorghi]|nr:hypothetical protein E4U53_005131 [Claviceps sorghi]